ncbi:MAG TPA: hypothetical protein VLE72_01555 [Candidatus Saccharimonadales bacterium]|nr:hypothetical protein [Candidatus Saccharimonadales bacterium]
MTIKPDSDFSSPADVQNLIIRLEEWQSRMRQSGLKQRLHIADQVKPDQHLVKDLRRLGISRTVEDQAGLDEVISSLKAWIKTATLIHLTFSTPPSPDLESQVADWLHSNIDPQILVQIQVDGTIAAGFVMRTKNRLSAFTANHVLWQNRVSITNLLQHVR